MKPKARMVEPVLATLVALIGTAFILSDPLGPHAHSLGSLPTVGSEFVSFLWNFDFVPVLEKTLIVASLCGMCWSWYCYAIETKPRIVTTVNLGSLPRSIIKRGLLRPYNNRRAKLSQIANDPDAAVSGSLLV